MNVRLVAAASAALLLAAMGAPVPAHASAIVSIGQADQFVHQVVDTDTGVVRWRWECAVGSDRCAGTHNVTAYSGASFASGNLTGAGSSYEVSLAAEQLPVKYRCTIHSSLQQDGHCSGMCGMIVRYDQTSPHVSVQLPSNGEIRVGAGLTVPITVSGSASDPIGIWKVVLRIYDTLGAARDHQVICPDCYQRVGEPAPSAHPYNWNFTPDVSWHVTLDLPPGSYRVEATAYDVPRTFWTRSTRTGFLVV